MSSSALEVVRTTTGIRRRSGSVLISPSASRPSFLGMLRSSRIRPGRGAADAAVGVRALAAEVVHEVLAVDDEAQVVDQPRCASARRR